MKLTTLQLAALAAALHITPLALLLALARSRGATARLSRLVRPASHGAVLTLLRWYRVQNIRCRSMGQAAYVTVRPARQNVLAAYGAR